MPNRQIATSTLWQLGSQVTMAALSILTVKFVAVGLSKELAGNYNSAYGFLQLFGILADFGLYAVAVREVSRATDRERVLGSVIVLRSIILMISLLSALLIVWIIPAWRGTPLPLGVTIAALVPLFTLLAGIVRTVFQVTYNMHYVFIAEVGQRIITTSLIGLFIYFGIRGSHDLHIYHLFLFWGGIGAFFLFYVSMRYANRLIAIRPNWDPEMLKILLKKAAPYGLAFFCVACYRNMDVTLIALLRDDFELQNAYYGFVTRMGEMGYLMPTFLLNSTLPILSEKDAKGEDTSALLGKVLLTVLLIGVISMVFAVAWNRPLISLLTTEQYLSSAARPGSDTALKLLGLPLLLNGLVTYCFYVLLTKNHWKSLATCLSIGTAVSLITNWTLIPALGFIGAGYTSIATHLILVILLVPRAQEAMRARITWKDLCSVFYFGLCLSAMLMALLPYMQHEIWTVGGLILTGFAMIPMLFAVGLGKLIR